MRPRTTSIVFPVLVTTVGVGWLLTVLTVDPRIYWIPVLGMAAIGILTLVMGGLDKVTVCVGPFLLICTGFAIARQTGQISVEVMLPCLVIVAGVLMFVAHFLPVPYPAWLAPSSQPAEHPKKLRLGETPAPGAHTAGPAEGGGTR
jgi:hypothetical protein